MPSDTKPAPTRRPPSAGVPASAPGTRDFYPADVLSRRFVTDAWRRTAIRHGFDEIDGPAFENLSLYEARSGPEITNRLFTFKRSGGVHQFALRPEFTPTVARMYAERHASLPKTVRWFSTGNCFRAERAGNGRLREFWQWNVDLLGDSSPAADAEVIATAIAHLRDVGFTPADIRVKLSSREVVGRVLTGAGVPQDRLLEAFETLDLRGKVSRPHMVRSATALGFELNAFESVAAQVASALQERRYDNLLASASASELGALGGLTSADLYQLADLARAIDAHGLLDWCDLDLSVVCGIAYYTGTVFQIRQVGRSARTLASGGRYDTLVEALGGPATPAVGFGMAEDQVIAALDEAGKLPSAADLQKTRGCEPDAWVAGDGTAASASATTRALAILRAGGLHARAAEATPSNERQHGLLVRVDASGRATIHMPGNPAIGPLDLSLLVPTVLSAR